MELVPSAPPRSYCGHAAPHHAEKCFHLLIGVVPGPAEPKQDGVQETILFLPLSSQLKERNLRCVTAAICWREQRRRCFLRTGAAGFKVSAGNPAPLPMQNYLPRSSK